MKVRTSLEILWTQGIIKELEKKIKEFKERDGVVTLEKGEQITFTRSIKY